MVIVQKMTYCMQRLYVKQGLHIPLRMVRRHASKVAQPVLTTKPKGSDMEEPSYFVDMRACVVSGGKGGDGVVSFASTRHNQFAGPDGGNGGSGGHVIFQVNENVKSLAKVPGQVAAVDGRNGAKRNFQGKNGQHTFVAVPQGTVFYSAEGQRLTCLDEPNDYYIGAHGGKGGRGNTAFATSTYVAPRIAEMGAKGEKNSLQLEMRIMADAGLVGFPNAGKSSLLRAISRARPLTSEQAFTTRSAHVGMVQYDDYEQVSVADIPGLVKGSHESKGLGFSFLRHIMKCTCLLYVLDLSSDDPWQQYEDLKHELQQYNAELMKRRHAIVGNKIDLPLSVNNFQIIQAKSNVPVFAISATEMTGIKNLLIHVRKMYDDIKSEEAVEPWSD
ncbi:mitochondrial ribosome-associated GTPase 2-like [Pecten maximus]|uniref:mitochondrial ribosome-associated GTPase 2-like n=1 Tax=Pecten maximus TaxID=6579 RepID=UPI001458E574|nr:mitochondrial ribosome-associated GTPase 2-like [Pecten maximus]XP_033753734.1 mitochondrial ribosome-associated GTPase 2-like [Pecten maximus]